MGRNAINKEVFLAELEKLLAFMSPWDRQAVIRRYAQRIEEAEDPEQLLEMFGTATKVAVMLADGYVSSPPPAEGTQPEIVTFSDEADAQLSLDELAPAEEEAPAAEPVPARKGAGPVYWIFAVVIGLPVAVLLLCLGLPFLACGAGALAAGVRHLPGLLGAFRLISDKLLLLGGGVAIGALGLLLAWFGLWLSLSLCRLWIVGILRVGRAYRGIGLVPALLGRVWKTVILVVLTMLILGVLLGGAGWLTGASLQRIQAVTGDPTTLWNELIGLSERMAAML